MWVCPKCWAIIYNSYGNGCPCCGYCQKKISCTFSPDTTSEYTNKIFYGERDDY